MAVPPSEEGKQQFAHDHRVTEWHWVWSTMDGEGAVVLVVGTVAAGAFSAFFDAPTLAEMLVEIERWRGGPGELPGPDEIG